MLCGFKEITKILEDLRKGSGIVDTNIIPFNRRQAYAKALEIKDAVVRRAYIKSVDDNVVGNGLIGAVDDMLQEDPAFKQLLADYTSLEANKEKAKEQALKSLQNKKDNGGLGAAKRAEENIKALEADIANIRFSISSLMDERSSEFTTAKDIKAIDKLIDKELKAITRLEGNISNSKAVKKAAKSRATKTDNKFKASELVSIALSDKFSEIIEYRNNYSVASKILDPLRAPQVPAASTFKSANELFKGTLVANSITRFGTITKSAFNILSTELQISPKHINIYTDAVALLNNTARDIKKSIAINADTNAIKAFDIDYNDKVGGMQSVSRLLIRDVNEFDNTGKPITTYKSMDPEMLTAMSAAANDWLSLALGNRAELRTDKDINRLLGKGDNDNVTQSMREQAALIDTFSTDAASKIGKAVTKVIGIKANHENVDNAELLLSKLELELGLIVLKSLEDNKVLALNQVKSDDVFNDKSSKLINVIKFNQTHKLLTEDSKLFDIQVKAINELLAVESDTKSARFHSTNGNKVFVNKSEQGKYFTTAPITQKAANRAENVKWSWEKDYVESIIDAASDEESRQKLLEYLGWRSTSGVHTRFHANINGKNSAIERNLSNLIGMKEYMDIEGYSEMYFDYFFGKNGRFYVDSSDFNPQGTKLHRFAIITGTTTVTEKNVNDQMLAMGQAFGLDIDKLKKDTALAEWRDVETKLDKLGVKDMSLVEAIDALSKNKIKGHDPEHLIAGLIEYKRYAKYKEENNGSTVGMEASLVLEVDAITSGYILKTMQMPLLDATTVHNHAAAGGVFFGKISESGEAEFEYDSYGAWKETKGNLDNYEDPASKMVDKLKALESTEVGNNELVKAVRTLVLPEVTNKTLRSLMKNPFMVFNYGSGLFAIRKALKENALDNLYSLMESSAKEDIQKVIDILSNSHYMFKTTKDGITITSGTSTNIASQYSNMTNAKRLELTLNKSIEDNIMAAVDASIGEAVSAVFEDIYSPYMEAGRTINNSFTAMFRLFKVKLDKALDKEAKVLGRILNQQEVDAVISTMTSSMPAISVALAENESDKLLIFDTDKVPVVEDEAGSSITSTGKYRLRANEERISELKKRLAVAKPADKKAIMESIDSLKGKVLQGTVSKYELVESYSSGAVIPIHFFDGSLMSLVLQDTDSLGVHDAVVTKIDVVTDIAKAYNTHMANLLPKYSLTAEVLSSLHESLNNATDEEIRAVNTQYVEEASEGKSPEQIELIDKRPILTMVNAMNSLYTKSEDARSRIYSQPIRYEHVAYEGSHYDWNTKGTAYDRVVPKVERKKDLENVLGNVEPTLGSSQESLAPDTFQSVLDSGIIPAKIVIEHIDDTFLKKQVAITTNKLKKCK